MGLASRFWSLQMKITICLLCGVVLGLACHPTTKVNYEEWQSRYDQATPYTDSNSLDSAEVAAIIKQAEVDMLLFIIDVEFDSLPDSLTIENRPSTIEVYAYDSQYVYLRVLPKVRSFPPESSRNPNSAPLDRYELWIYDRFTKGQRAVVPFPESK